MYKRDSSAFTLIEMVVVLVVVGIITTIISTWVFRKRPRAEWPNVLDEMNDLMSFAMQEAISDRKNYRLVFQANKNQEDVVLVEREEDDEEKPGKKIYQRVNSEYLETRYVFPPQIKLVGVFKKTRRNLLDENKGIAYCYIVPNGLVEDCVIHLERTLDDFKMQATFKSNPFLGLFTFYEGLLQPSKVLKEFED